jgi:5-methylthioadenosine/S-adenosylhomocysteine deaminase
LPIQHPHRSSVSSTGKTASTLEHEFYKYAPQRLPADSPGEIAPGQLADLVLINLESDTFLPLHDPYLHLVYCEYGVSVDTVIVNGEVVVERGKVTTVDELALRREVRELCNSTWSQLPAHLDHSAATHEIVASLDTLRQLILQKNDKM